MNIDGICSMCGEVFSTEEIMLLHKKKCINEYRPEKADPDREGYERFYDYGDR